ncbi:hypothetical protein [Streptomyces sp. NPDC047014]|uniref:hypothetical protein n=1 Tax=Streptomyces sp. NPDC047014 TaxID=3155736 RepID=UPI0033CC9E4B
MKPWSTANQRALRQLLNAWDPVGVADSVEDEYDCMLAPLLGRLCRGAGQAEIDAYLRHELEEHFGLDPSGSHTDAVAGQVTAWWASGGPAAAAGVRG